MCYTKSVIYMSTYMHINNKWIEEKYLLLISFNWGDNSTGTRRL
jgi:hypothetical protein